MLKLYFPAKTSLIVELKKIIIIIIAIEEEEWLAGWHVDMTIPFHSLPAQTDSQKAHSDSQTLPIITLFQMTFSRIRAPPPLCN